MIYESLIIVCLAVLSYIMMRRNEDLLFLSEAAHGETATHQDRLSKLIEVADRYYREKKLLPAEKAYLRVLKLDHKNIVAYNRLGFIYSHFGNHADAVECFEIVVRAHSTAVAHQNLGMAYYKKQDYARGAAELKKSAEIEPTTARYLSLARIYRMGEEIEQQRTALEQAVALDPDNVEILNLLAEVHLKLKDKGAARSIFARIVELDPKNQRARAAQNALKS